MRRCLHGIDKVIGGGCRSLCGVDIDAALGFLFCDGVGCVNDHFVTRIQMDAVDGFGFKDDIVIDNGHLVECHGARVFCR